MVTIGDMCLGRQASPIPKEVGANKINEGVRAVRLAIIGSRSIIKDESKHKEAFSIISTIYDFYDEWNAFNKLEGLVIVSGGFKDGKLCPGIDEIAIRLAWDRNYKTQIYYSKGWTWPQFKIRNILIAEDCTSLVCIRDANSKSYGSGWTADYAQSIGKPVYRVTL